MSESDITELAQIKYRCLNILPFSSFLSVLSLLAYFAFRIKTSWDAYVLGTDHWACLNTCLYLLSEIGILCKTTSPYAKPYAESV